MQEKTGEKRRGNWPWGVGILVLAACILLGDMVADSSRAQAFVLAITAGVAAWYAGATWRMAEAARRSTELQEASLQLGLSSELYAWQVWQETDLSAPYAVFRIRNAGRATALNVVAHPMFREWCADRPGGSIHLTDRADAWTDMPDPSRSASCSTPVLPPESWGHFAISGMHRSGRVLCIRWDDQGRGRRWRCWELSTSSDADHMEFQRKRIRDKDPAEGCACEDICPEKQMAGTCPHVLRLTSAERFRRLARELYGHEH